MKCVICKHGNTVEGTTTVTLEKNGSTIVFKNVPALVCDNCGEAYVTDSITKKLLESAREIVKSGAEVDVRHFDKSAA